MSIQIAPITEDALLQFQSEVQEQDSITISDWRAQSMINRIRQLEAMATTQLSDFQEMTHQLHADLRVAWKLLEEAGHSKAADRVSEFLTKAADSLKAASLGTKSMSMNSQRQEFELFVRSGASPVPPSEVDGPLANGTYRTSAANAGWAFWLAAQAALQQQSRNL